MSTNDHANASIGLVSPLQLIVDRALLEALVNTHPNPKKLHEAWAMELPKVISQGEHVIDIFKYGDPIPTAFSTYISNTNSLLTTAKARRDAEEMLGKSFID